MGTHLTDFGPAITLTIVAVALLVVLYSTKGRAK
jgi:hypothetical protein